MHTANLLATALWACSLSWVLVGAACPHNSIHIMGVPPDQPHRQLGLLAYTITALLDAFPGSTNETIDYPNQSPHMGIAVGIGSNHTRQRIIAYSAQCPNTPIVLAGYSEGAIVMMNALCGSNTPVLPKPLSSSYAPHILAAIGYGDESFVANQTWSAGSCVNDAPHFARKNPAGCHAFAPAIKDYCNSEDPECCTGGDNATAHYTYQNQYDGAIVDFVHERLNGTA